MSAPRCLRAVMALSLLFPGVPARAETPDESRANRAAIDAYWEGLKAKAPEGKMELLTGAQVFDPAFVATLKTDDQRYYHDFKARVWMKSTVDKRDVSSDAERELKNLFADSRGKDGNGANQAMKGNPAVRELLWNAAQGGPGGEAQRKRLLEAYAEAKKANAELTLKDFLKGLDADKVLAILAPDKVKEKDPAEPEKTAPGKAPDASRKAAEKERKSGAPGDVLASVGFDGAQAYGVPGDRHVYQDGAGNTVSLSISSRRMPDGTLEDVVHVVNINNRAAPHGATFSLRSDIDKLQAGVPVTIGGVSFSLKLTANGDDHAISMEGGSGPFLNLKAEREPPMTVSQLYAYRAARVFSYGRVVEIGGREYYVAPETYSQLEGQGEAAKFVGYGQFSYWPKDQLDKVFAADPKTGRDEVDPQTFDFKTLDLAGSGFMGVRGIRPGMVATVIRREGAQDVAAPRASLGQDQNGQWWDAVLKDGQYVIEKGQPPPQPGTGGPTGTPGQQVPPEGLSLADGRKYVPNGPLAERLNSLLAGAAKSRIRFLENPNEAKRDQRVLLVVDNRIDSIGFLPYFGAEAQPPSSVTGEDIREGRFLETQTNKGKEWVDLEVATARGVVEAVGKVGSFAEGKGFTNVQNPAVLRLALAAANYSAADAQTIIDRLTAARAKQGGAPIVVEGPMGGKTEPIKVYFTLPSGEKVEQTIWPTLSEPGKSAAPGVGSGYTLDPAGANGGGTSISVGFPDERELAKDRQKVGRVGASPGEHGAALYTVKKDGADLYYLAYTVKSAGGKPRQMPLVLAFDSSTKQRVALPPAGAVTYSGIDLAGPMPDESELLAGPFISTDGKSGYIGLFSKTAGKRFERCLGVAAYWGTEFRTAKQAVDHANSQ
ncbi:MAG: hypothetical protein HY928_01750 [Elusimicrobia bacterium]|nr:hypothetical protein [Elusimicrobiota bacterium]